MSNNNVEDHGRRPVDPALAAAIVPDGPMIDDATLLALGQQFEALMAKIRAVEQSYISRVAKRGGGDPEAEAVQLIEALSRCPLQSPLTQLGLMQHEENRGRLPGAAPATIVAASNRMLPSVAAGGRKLSPATKLSQSKSPRTGCSSHPVRRTYRSSKLSLPKFIDSADFTD